MGKDMPNRIVHVADGGAGHDHPTLLSKTALLHTPQWIAGDAPGQLQQGLPLQLQS